MSACDRGAESGCLGGVECVFAPLKGRLVGSEMGVNRVCVARTVWFLLRGCVFGCEDVQMPPRHGCHCREPERAPHATMPGHSPELFWACQQWPWHRRSDWLVHHVCSVA